MKGLLEVRLDLGVVGSEDAVAGVGGLAVDRPSSLGGRWFVALGQCRSFSAMMGDDAKCMRSTPMIEAEIRELTPQPSAAIRVTQPMSELDLAALFDEHLPNIAHRLADMGVEPAGPPYGRYHEFGPEHVDVEIGIPVDLPVSNFRTYDEASPAS